MGILDEDPADGEAETKRIRAVKESQSQYNIPLSTETSTRWQCHRHNIALLPPADEVPVHGDRYAGLTVILIAWIVDFPSLDQFIRIRSPAV